MKIRAGFVSNSSSSSFCVVGYELPSDIDIEEIEGKVNKNGLEITYGISDDYTVVGKSIEEINDDQTMLDYKKEILKKIRECIDENISINDINIIIDGGYDG